MKLNIINSGANNGSYNMSCDREIIQEISDNPDHAVLRWYTWNPPAFSLGYGQKPEEIFNNLSDIEWVKRPTGGSLVYHGGDISYSFTLSRENPWGIKCSCDLYNYISSSWVEGFRRLGIPVEKPQEVPKAKEIPQNIRNLCLAFTSPGDLILKGKKIGGSAQRKLRNVWHQQGFIMLRAINIPDCFKDKSMISLIKNNSADLETLGFDPDPEMIIKTLSECLTTKCK